MQNPAFIGIDDMQRTYLPMGFSHFKIEGRGLGSALILEFLLYYLVKPAYHLPVREAIYLDSMLICFEKQNSWSCVTQLHGFILCDIGAADKPLPHALTSSY